MSLGWQFLEGGACFGSEGALHPRRLGLSYLGYSSSGGTLCPRCEWGDSLVARGTLHLPRAGAGLRGVFQRRDPLCPQGWGPGVCSGSKGDPVSPPGWVCLGGCFSTEADPGAGCGGMLQRGGDPCIPTGSSTRAGAQHKLVLGLCSRISRIHGTHIRFSHPEVLREPPKQGPRWDPPARGQSSVGTNGSSVGPRGLEPCYGGLAVAVGTSPGTSKCLSSVPRGRSHPSVLRLCCGDCSAD